MIYIGSFDGRLYALDARTGQEKWSFKTGSRVVSSPAVAGGMVYVGSGDGRLYALDARTGQEKWRFKTAMMSIPPSGCGWMVYVGIGMVGSTHLTPGLVRRSGASKPTVRSFPPRRWRAEWCTLQVQTAISTLFDSMARQAPVGGYSVLFSSECTRNRRPG